MNWEQVIKEQLDRLPYDRNNVSLWDSPGGGYFMQLMGLMGFTEGYV